MKDFIRGMGITLVVLVVILIFSYSLSREDYPAVAQEGESKQTIHIPAPGSDYVPEDNVEYEEMGDGFLD